MSHTLACMLRRPRSLAGWALVLIGLFLAGAPDAGNARPPEDPPASVRVALAAANRGDWPAAQSLGSRLADPVSSKLMFWLRATRGDGSVSFGEINAFLAANPDWPNGAALIRRAEESLPEGKSPRAVVSWFGQREPATPYGRYRLARAFFELGDQERAGELARRSWRGGDLYYPDLERSFRATFASLLSMGDHRARLDALLWDGRETAARRLYEVVGADRRALAEARILLRQQRRNADAAVSAVPPALQADPGLAYERIRRLRQKGQEAEARKLLAQVKQDAGRPDLWWTERHALARDALRRAQAAMAYRLVRAHALEEPSDYAEAEWLAGWIALRFLNDPAAARGHFLNMGKVVRFPISVARAAYWAGRAGEAAGDKPFAMGWYRSAAAYPTTFYGRLAAERVSPDSTLVLPPAPEPTRTERAAFLAHELVRAARLLAAHGQGDAARAFIRRLGEIRDAPAWQAMTAELATEIGGTGFGVATAKRAMREGFLLFEQAYPLMPLPVAAERLPHPVEPALVLAMIRQESEFDRTAVSSAGARGLMQLMPATAKQVAASLDLPYSPDRLTRDPAYNVKLGRAYLSKLLGSFDGSVALAFAAYNAGPARVREWLDTYGDPRRGRVDLIDWIEMLPYAETRNYVQRAIENRWVYQARLNGDAVLLASGLGR